MRSVFACVALAIAAAQTPAARSWQADMLRDHNNVRSSLGLPAMEWSPVLAQEAQRWADTLIGTGEFRHDGDHRHGQNLFAIERSRATVAFVFDSWASEAADYNYARNSCRDVCGHYTQIVWRTSRYVGCAIAQNRTRQVWVCDYYPPGNVVGERPY